MHRTCRDGKCLTVNVVQTVESHTHADTGIFELHHHKRKCCIFHYALRVQEVRGETDVGGGGGVLGGSHC